MKHFFFLCLSLLMTICDIRADVQTDTYVYNQELKALKNSEYYKIIFDHEDALQGARRLRRDIENCKQLSFVQRLIRTVFLNLDTIVVDAHTMPHLYSYINTLCTTHGIKTPTIFITTKSNFYNAAASKLLMSTGAIVIGQKIIKESSDQVVESVIAHEIGHIKYNHVNKMIAIALACCYAGYQFSKRMVEGYDSALKIYYGRSLSSFEAAGIQLVYNMIYNQIFTSLALMVLVNKRFERQADRFAYEEVGKGKGLVKFFENIEQKHQNHKDDLATTSKILSHSASELAWYDNIFLNVDYYMTKIGFDFHRARRWLYHNTPIGAHPSPTSRIKAVQKYWADNNIVQAV